MQWGFKGILPNVFLKRVNTSVCLKLDHTHEHFMHTHLTYGMYLDICAQKHTHSMETVVKQRFLCFAQAFLSMVGVGSIGLTILVTYGLCSAFGLFFGPMHNVIPFLFLGIGN
jgi:hypothetical protein